MNNTMTCNKCSNEIDSDSLFCQYCGNKVPIESKVEIKRGNKKTQKKDNIFLSFSWVISFTSIVVCILIYISFNNRIINYEEQITSKDKEIKTLDSNYKEMEINSLYYKDKADYFDDIINKVGSSSNTKFLASKTVLRNPLQTRVVFYLDYSGSYTITSAADPGVMVTFGSTSSGLVYADITYYGTLTGVKTISFTNDYNKEEIIIYCIGS